MAVDRDWAATAQRAFELEVLDILSPYLTARVPDFDGLAISGGCALNVLSNSRVERVLNVPVSVPSAPNDGGLSLGACWQLTRPRVRQVLQYAGPPLFDSDDKDALVAAFAAAAAPLERVQVEEDVPVEAVAALLAEGAVVGVARRRAEFGPRALGHRSLLAAPFGGAKDAMNVIKFREWWRPVAPMVAVEDALRVFTTLPRSPYMSFAPDLTDEAKAALPAIVHFDGTARPQIVYAEEAPWLHALLVAVKRRTGWAVLINTSFNTRGKPILNTAREALTLLADSPGMSAVVLEDTLVHLPGRALAARDPG